MSVSSDYATPVTVNGFTCKNCTDVDYAKKHIDPAHPKDGPYGVNAQDSQARSPAVTLSGRLAGLDLPSGPAAAQTSAPALDIRI